MIKFIWRVCWYVPVVVALLIAVLICRIAYGMDDTRELLVDLGYRL